MHLSRFCDYWKNVVPPNRSNPHGRCKWHLDAGALLEYALFVIPVPECVDHRSVTTRIRSNSMQKNERRRALANFLRQRRASLSPDEVGLLPGLRRRTPGLRREEVAQLANIGTSWYVWLEQGRDVHPSAPVLESLAQALRLTPNERRHLFLLAGQALPPPVSPAEESIGPALQHVLDDLNPSPASVLGRRYDYLACNKPPDALFTILDTFSDPPSPYPPT